MLPFVLLAVLPAQVMPSRGPEGLRLTLCTQSGPVDVVIDLATGKPVPATADGHERCAWAAAQVAVALLSAPSVQPWQAAEATVPHTLAAPQAPRATAISVHLPRGPPVPV